MSKRPAASLEAQELKLEEKIRHQVAMAALAPPGPLHFACSPGPCMCIHMRHSVLVYRRSAVPLPTVPPVCCAFAVQLAATGKRDELKQLLAAKLAACGWKDDIKQRCRGGLGA
jgi:hypothetical protein